MRQRNDTPHAQNVMAWPTADHPDQAPFTAGPGEVVDFHEPLAGFTVLADEPAVVPAKTARKNTPAASEGGEPA